MSQRDPVGNDPACPACQAPAEQTSAPLFTSPRPVDPFDAAIPRFRHEEPDHSHGATPAAESVVVHREAGEERVYVDGKTLAEDDAPIEDMGTLVTGPVRTIKGRVVTRVQFDAPVPAEQPRLPLTALDAHVYEALLGISLEPAWQTTDDDAAWLAEVARRLPGLEPTMDALHGAQRRLIADGRMEYVGNKGVRGLPLPAPAEQTPAPLTAEELAERASGVLDPYRSLVVYLDEALIKRDEETARIRAGLRTAIEIIREREMTICEYINAGRAQAHRIAELENMLAVASEQLTEIRSVVHAGEGEPTAVAVRRALESRDAALRVLNDLAVERDATLRAELAVLRQALREERAETQRLHALLNEQDIPF